MEPADKRLQSAAPVRAFAATDECGNDGYPDFPRRQILPKKSSSERLPSKGVHDGT